MQAILRLLRYVNRLITETETAYHRIFPSLKNGELLMMPTPVDPTEFLDETYNSNNSTGVAGASSTLKPRLMSKRLLFFGTFLSVLFLTMAFSSKSFGQATVTSDADDYAPRSTATFTGAGFQPFEEVQLKVKNLSYPCNTVFADSSYLPWTVTADADGGFVTTWLVCDCPGDSLRLKVTGLTSGYIAYTYFTDAAGDGTGTMTVSPSPVCTSSTGNNFVFTFTTPSNRDFNLANSQVELTVQSGFSSFQNSNSSGAGYISIGLGTATSVAITSISSTTLLLNVNMLRSTSFTISYSNVSVPAVANNYTFAVRTRSGSTAPPGASALAAINPNNATIGVIAPPTTTAGADQLTICGTTATLAANKAPNGSAGLWTITSGTGGSFSSTSDEKATFTGTAGVAYVLKWTITTGQCSNSDEVNITLNQNPTTADAGTPQTICFNSTATLDANTPDVGAGAGLWSIVGGSPDMSPTQFSSTSDPNAIFTPAAAGNYTLKWTISNSPCTASSDNVAITVRALPTATISIQSPNPTTICTSGTTVFRLTGPANGSVTYNDGIKDTTVTLNGGGNLNLTTVALTSDRTYTLVKVRYPTSGSDPTCETNVTGFVTVTVVAQPLNPTINVKSPDVTSVCAGQNVSATFNAGSGGLGCSDDFEYSTNGGTSWTAYTPGANISTASLAGQTVMIHGRHNNCTANTGCTATYDLLASWTVQAPTVVTGHFINSAPNTTNTSFVYGCTTPVLSVTATGQGTVTYKWFRTTTSTNSGGTQVGTGSSYTVPAATPVGTYYYHAEAIATCGTTPSNVFTVVINQQEASAENDGALYYTGPANAWTPNTSSNTATVTLSAFIKNSTAADAVCGDIATARITFQVKNSAGAWTNIPSAQNLPVYYVDPNNPSKGGTAAAIVQLNISNNSATQIFDLKVIVGGNYKAAEKCGYSQITISKLVPGGAISGGTLLCGNTASGLLRPSAIIPSLLGFGVEYVVKQGKVQSPKGKLNLYVSSYSDLNGVNTFPTLNWYKISTNAIASLTITGKTSTTNAKASFTSKANVARYNFNTGETIPIEGNCTMVLDIEDVNCTGAINFQDKVAITVYRNAGGNWYSNNWVTSQTIPRNICGGDVTASGTTTPISSPSTLDESTRVDLVTPGTFKVRAFPNPTTHLFTIDVQSASNEPIEVKVFDMMGHMVYYRNGLLKQEHHRFGQMLTDGMYMLHVKQGDKQQTITVIKK
jgi:hypothetical protein